MKSSIRLLRYNKNKYLMNIVHIIPIYVVYSKILNITAFLNRGHVIQKY